MREILMLIPVYKRPEILKECYASIKGLPVARLWIVSPEDKYLTENIKTVNRTPDDYIVKASNKALGAKMNTGIRHAVEYIGFWDYLMGWGSDNLMDAKLLDLYKGVDEKYFGINSVFMFDTITGEVVFYQDYNNGAPLGAGRMLHRSLIMRMINKGVDLYDDRAMSGLDGNLHERVTLNTKVKAKIIDSGIHPYVVDLKCATNINPFQFFRSMPRCKRDIVDRVHGQITNKYG